MTTIYQSKNPIIQEIETIIRNKYPEGFAYKFLGKNANQFTRKGLSIDDFKKQIGLELPDSFYQFYEWLLNVEFPEKNVSKQTYMDYHQHQISTLQTILDDTKFWQQIQAKDPKREWKKGFVAILSYNSAYQMVIDTLGEINGQKGCIAYWDFKGGSWYYVDYIDFDHFLKTKLELLKQNLYFPPSLNEEDLNEDAYTYDDFIYGEPSEKIKKIAEQINGKQVVVSF
jgi:hypothetical protein